MSDRTEAARRQRREIAWALDPSRPWQDMRAMLLELDRRGVGYVVAFLPAPESPGRWVGGGIVAETVGGVLRVGGVETTPDAARAAAEAILAAVEDYEKGQTP